MSEGVILKPTSKHTSTIIFLHGLGDTGLSWVQLLNEIRPSGMKIICPTANKIPVTLLGGAKVTAWFDLINTDENADINEDENDINISKNKIHSLIEQEIKYIKTNQIILGGFSQGGSMALYSALLYHKQLAGVIALSCWLPLHKQYPSYVIAPENLPIFQAHGELDPICPLRIAKLTHTLLRAYSRNAQFFIYKNLSHSIGIDEISDMKEFMKQVLKNESIYKNNWCCCLKS